VAVIAEQGVEFRLTLISLDYRIFARARVSEKPQDELLKDYGLPGVADYLPTLRAEPRVKSADRRQPAWLFGPCGAERQNQSLGRSG
jgi:hypothetical protein